MIDAFALADSLRDGFGTRSVSVELTDEPIEVPASAHAYLDHGLPAAWTESLAK